MLIGSLVICLILFLFKKIATNISKYVLIVKGKNINLTEVEKVLDKDLNSYLCKGKYIDINGIELIYDIKFKKKQDDKIITHLSKLDGVTTINLVASNTDTMG